MNDRSGPSRIPFHGPTAGGRLIAGVAVLALLALGGCAASTGERSGGDPSRITQDELERTSANTLYEMVERERPRWMRSRGARSFNLDTEIIVAQGGRYYGDLEALRDFRPEHVSEIQYWDSSRATAEISGIGQRHVEGAIVLYMRR